jgi:hypothetical protein
MIFKGLIFRSLWVIILVIGIPGLSHGISFTYSSLDYPGASQTFASGINDSGQVVGIYEDATGWHGFLLSGGSYSSLDYPGASYTSAYGINDAGQVVGEYGDATGWHGFLLSGGSYSSLDYPGASYSITLGINDAGQVVGFYGDATGGHGFIVTLVIEVEVDIKPGSDPNSINLKSKGVIPAAILTTDDFDATTVDPLSVQFGPDGATEVHGKGHIEDVDDDGDTDLVFHFKTQETGIQCGDTEAGLAGETFDGQAVEGFDSVITKCCDSDVHDFSDSDSDSDSDGDGDTDSSDCDDDLD